MVTVPRKLFLRIVFSIVTYGVFVVLAVSWVLTTNPTLKWMMFVPLIGAILTLPRRLPKQLSDDVVEGSEAERSLVRTRLWLSYVRLAYFLVALFVMLGLPELLR